MSFPAPSLGVLTKSKGKKRILLFQWLNVSVPETIYLTLGYPQLTLAVNGLGAPFSRPPQNTALTFRMALKGLH